MKKNDDDDHLTYATEVYRKVGHMFANDGKYKKQIKSTRSENSNKSRPEPKFFPEADTKNTFFSSLLNRKNKK